MEAIEQHQQFPQTFRFNIDLLEPDGRPSETWEIEDAYISRIEADDLDYNDDNALHQFRLEITYNNARLIQR